MMSSNCGSLCKALLSGRTCAGSLPLPAGTTSPNVFISPRIWLESSVVICTSRFRAATNVRPSMLSKPLTRTSRKNPISASCARPSASWASVLLGAMSRAALAWRASMQIAGSPSAVSVIEPHGQGPGLEHHPSGPRCAAADHLGDEPRIGAALAAPDPFAVAADRHRRFLHRHVQTYIRSHLHPPVSSTQARAIARRPRDTIMIGRAAVGSTPAPTLSERWGDSLPRLPHVDAPDGLSVPEWGC